MREIDGVKCEPFEHLVIDAPDDCTGAVIEKLGKRKAEMKAMNPTGDLEIAVDEEALNVITVHFTYVTATTSQGKKNATYAVLEKLLKMYVVLLT